MIYFVQVAPDGPVKIGFTSGDPMERFYTIQSGNHTKLDLIGVCDGGKIEEGALHARFRDDHIRGEWFQFSDSLKKYLNERFADFVRPREAKPTRKAFLRIEDKAA